VEGLQKRICNSEYDLKVAGHCGRQRTLELTTRNFQQPIMEQDIFKYCNECDNCRCTKSSRHAKHGLLHSLDLACKAWTHISTDFVPDPP